MKASIRLISLVAVVSGKTPVFDYVVVGSGPAGSMVAMGLAEKGFHTLLMEAGEDHVSPNITTPAFHVRASEDASIAWDFFVKHYDASTGLRQKVLYPRVGGLGGCTLHNAMIHILPNPVDYKNMVALTGDPSWGETNMRRYYNKITRPSMLERSMPARLMNQLGTPMQRLSGTTIAMASNKTEAVMKLATVNVFNLISNDKKLFDLMSNVLQSALMSNMLGYDINSYLRSGQAAIDSESTFLIPTNADANNGGKRTGVRERLKVAAKTTPLTIWTSTLSTKVLLNSKNQAYGVQFLKGKYLYKAGKRVSATRGKSGQVFARREVIVSGGTFNTPQLMMLSGIGDPAHLAKMGIKPRVNLPGVGRNLHDRYEVSVNVRFDKNFALLEQCKFRESISDPCFKQFKESGSGPYSFNGVLTGTTVKSNKKLKTPDMFFLTAPIDFRGYHVGMGDEVTKNKDMFTYLILLARTHNRSGYVRLRSKDPTAVPEINFRYFTQGADKDMPPLIKGIRDVRQKLAKFSTEFREEKPGPHVRTDKQIADHIVKNAWGHHATGTMKIGRDGDPMGVLDGKFRVRGVGKLRVVDMSIFPDIPGNFPVLFLYMVGAKAADVIAADAKH